VQAWPGPCQLHTCLHQESHCDAAPSPLLPKSFLSSLGPALTD
jgi:hypothetical protein